MQFSIIHLASDDLVVNLYNKWLSVWSDTMKFIDRDSSASGYIHNHPKSTTDDIHSLPLLFGSKPVLGWYISEMTLWYKSLLRP